MVIGELKKVDSTLVSFIYSELALGYCAAVVHNDKKQCNCGHNTKGFFTWLVLYFSIHNLWAPNTPTLRWCLFFLPIPCWRLKCKSQKYSLCLLCLVWCTLQNVITTPKDHVKYPSTIFNHKMPLEVCTEMLSVFANTIISSSMTS